MTKTKTLGNVDDDLEQRCKTNPACLYILNKDGLTTLDLALFEG